MDTPVMEGVEHGRSIPPLFYSDKPFTIDTLEACLEYRCTMLLSDLDYSYPPELIALKPSTESRVMLSKNGQVSEISKAQTLELMVPGDLLVINNTKVIPARVFAKNELEILFIRAKEPNIWEVLFPARETKIGDAIDLPGDLKIELIQKGLPQKVKLSREIDATYFEQHGELALPPYIQQQRASRHNQAEDSQWYQTAWASQIGSTAAPTASLHFRNEDLAQLRAKGVEVCELTLHVGPGTFLPVKVEKLNEHQMHEEWVSIPEETLKKIRLTKARGQKVWALGTTVTRALESWSNSLLQENASEKGLGVSGMSRLFIYPPYEFKVVDALLTNFHQPRSTLIALVGAFAGLDQVKAAYQWAIERRFRLFSYGDLSVWIK